ncbi:hypothetical protein KC19_10G169900 [Ceratodon purpureus]|uniref:Uncharacterized protein n=1 Tax=Ceratodon purpureus TaxID=3225 RepID=A0A8T0GRI5_CERPU|nr:hypothetical protein KC19_10G169900 [Ceratodon purpureus]
MCCNMTPSGMHSQTTKPLQTKPHQSHQHQHLQHHHSGTHQSLPQSSNTPSYSLFKPLPTAQDTTQNCKISPLQQPTLPPQFTPHPLQVSFIICPNVSFSST